MIAIGCDHAGRDYKYKIIDLLHKYGMKCLDVGESHDYPDIAKLAVQKVQSSCAPTQSLDGLLSTSECTKAILICGTGIGMSIAANRHTHIRAAVCESIYTVEMARKHNNINVLCIGQNVLPWSSELKYMILTFLTMPFDRDQRHVIRLSKL